MRTVVSVSMLPELATRLKASATERGMNFSARVCELIEAGMMSETGGLFTPTVSDDGAPFSVEPGKKSGTDRDPSDTGSEPESSLPSDRLDVIDSGNEDQPEPRREPVGTPAERVYSCVSSERTSLKQISERADVTEVEAGEILERLIEDDQPIILRRSGGDWVCWVEAA